MARHIGKYLRLGERALVKWPTIVTFIAMTALSLSLAACTPDTQPLGSAPVAQSQEAAAMRLHPRRAEMQTCSQANQIICVSFCDNRNQGVGSPCMIDCQNFQARCLATGQYVSNRSSVPDLRRE